ncbi:MAG: Spy/CpxP family protein refolding chaperone [Syntrophobacteraceae bacterium]
MLKKSLILLAAIISLLIPAISQAKDIPPGRWWRIPYFVDQLKITDQQKTELDQLYDRNRNRLSELKKQMERERVDLTRVLEGEDLNENAAVVQLKKLENTRAVLAATRFSYSLEVRKLLGHDRFQQLKTLYRNWHGELGN